MPVKDGQPLPIFDYEMYLFDDMEGNKPADIQSYKLDNTGEQQIDTTPYLKTRGGIGARRQNKIKYLAIKKSRGLGVTEFFLRYMAWLAVCKNEEYSGKRFFIVCGPGESTALDLIKRLKTVLESLELMDDTERSVCKVKNVEINARPGAHVEALRGYDNIKFILVDEASFWVGEEQAKEIRSVVEGYIAKTHPTIAFISTPNVPNTMYERIIEESEETCLYKRYFMPWQTGYLKIYSKEDIEYAKRSPNFEREMNLKYGVGTGNIFEDKDIDDVIIDTECCGSDFMQEVIHYVAGVERSGEIGVSSPTSQSVTELPPNTTHTHTMPPTTTTHHTNNTSNNQGHTPLTTDRGNTIVTTDTSNIHLEYVCLGVDPGFGSSSACIVVLGMIDDVVVVVDAQRYPHASFRDFADRVYETFMEHNAHKIFIDASARDVVTDLKISLREQIEYEYVKKEARKNYSYDVDGWMQRMIVVPINFSQYNDKMLRGLVSMVLQKHLLIPRRFDDLILDLRMAREKAGQLDKSGVNTMDLFDALRLATLMYDYA